jgi:hypothetical protein
MEAFSMKLTRTSLFAMMRSSPSSKSYSRKAKPLKREGLAGNSFASLIGKEKTIMETGFFLINDRLQDHG